MTTACPKPLRVKGWSRIHPLCKRGHVMAWTLRLVWADLEFTPTIFLTRFACLPAQAKYKHVCILLSGVNGRYGVIFVWVGVRYFLPCKSPWERHKLSEGFMGITAWIRSGNTHYDDYRRSDACFEGLNRLFTIMGIMTTGFWSALCAASMQLYFFPCSTRHVVDVKKVTWLSDLLKLNCIKKALREYIRFIIQHCSYLTCLKNNLFTIMGT